MTTIHAILDDLARTATDARDKGDKFERLMAAYLRTDPPYKDRCSTGIMRHFAVRTLKL